MRGPWSPTLRSPHQLWSLQTTPNFFQDSVCTLHMCRAFEHEHLPLLDDWGEDRKSKHVAEWSKSINFYSTEAQAGFAVL